MRDFWGCFHTFMRDFLLCFQVRRVSIVLSSLSLFNNSGIPIYLLL